MLNAELQFELNAANRPSATREIVVDGRRLEVTPVFDTYWRFACQRQEAYFRRLDHQWPYTV